MCDGVARSRAFEVVATRCDTAQQGLRQPFSALGAMATERSRMASAASAASGTQLNLLIFAPVSANYSATLKNSLQE